jgi:hypothetical protein
MVEPVRHRQTKEAETDMFEPKATAPHLDSTDLNLSKAQHWTPRDERESRSTVQPDSTRTHARRLGTAKTHTHDEPKLLLVPVWAACLKRLEEQ